MEKGFHIRLTIVEFKLQYDPKCLKDYVELIDGSELTDPVLGRFCGHVYPAFVASSENEMLVRFRTDSSVVKTGFKAFYTSIRGNPLTFFVTKRLRRPLVTISSV